MFQHFFRKRSRVESARVEIENVFQGLQIETSRQATTLRDQLVAAQRELASVSKDAELSSFKWEKFFITRLQSARRQLDDHCTSPNRRKKGSSPFVQGEKGVITTTKAIIRIAKSGRREVEMQLCEFQSFEKEWQKNIRVLGKRVDSWEKRATKANARVERRKLEAIRRSDVGEVMQSTHAASVRCMHDLAEDCGMLADEIGKTERDTRRQITRMGDAAKTRARAIESSMLNEIDELETIREAQRLQLRAGPQVVPGLLDFVRRN